jgi:hypothetical protein
VDLVGSATQTRVSRPGGRNWGVDQVNETGWMKPGVGARRWSSGRCGCGSCASLLLLRLRDSSSGSAGPGPVVFL